MARVILLGLAPELADQITGVLLDEAHTVVRGSLSDARIEAEFDAAFISGDAPDFARHLAAFLQIYPLLPAVVVTRLPETSRWLDALEAGARDYCGAPFEHVQIRWIMDSVCPRARLRAA